MYTKSITLTLQHDLQVSRCSTESRVYKTSMNYLDCYSIGLSVFCRNTVMLWVRDGRVQLWYIRSMNKQMVALLALTSLGTSVESGDAARDVNKSSATSSVSLPNRTVVS